MKSTINIQQFEVKRSQRHQKFFILTQHSTAVQYCQGEGGTKQRESRGGGGNNGGSLGGKDGWQWDWGGARPVIKAAAAHPQRRPFKCEPSSSPPLPSSHPVWRSSATLNPLCTEDVTFLERENVSK